MAMAMACPWPLFFPGPKNARNSRPKCVGGLWGRETEIANLYLYIKAPILASELIRPLRFLALQTGTGTRTRVAAVAVAVALHEHRPLYNPGFLIAIGGCK